MKPHASPFIKPKPNTNHNSEMICVGYNMVYS